MKPFSYQPADALYLWYLRDPGHPVLVGTLSLVLTGTRGVSLRYAPSWRQTGFPLSEDLPLLDMEHLPAEKDRAAGAVDDARPDRWGERVIRLLERPPRLSLLEMLYFAGDDRFGALGVSTSAQAYEPHLRGPLPELGDIDRVHELVRKVLAGEPVPQAARRLITPGATMGGACPKALIETEGAQWVLKFSEDAGSSEPLIEHAAMTLAARAGITVAQTRPVPLARGAAVLVKRFDRLPGTRVHALSANVALRAAGVEMSYPELAQLLRRRGPTAGHRNRLQMRELFRRLVFNILMDNTDDHEKNHALLVSETQQYELAPAFDVLPTGQALGYQSMIVGDSGAESSIDNALSTCRAYWLSRQEATEQVHQVAAVVNTWRDHFKTCGVPRKLIDQYADQIDRPLLLQQRRQFSG
ncbi:MAG: HipA domain-containing protein [Burkholderiales bacterium]